MPGQRKVAQKSGRGEIGRVTKENKEDEIFLSTLRCLLPLPYLLLIRYEAVSSTPVIGLEMVALRSCEARDMIYPHTATHIQRCVHICVLA